MSPASGDISFLTDESNIATGFHSINVPSEWGLEDTNGGGAILNFRAINSFHSINVPSEWGLKR